MGSLGTRVSAAICTCASLICAAQAETLVLSSKFVDDVKNKATITTTLEVDAHPSTPHPISSGGNDGDIHMAGRAEEVQLPLVAEIINAKAPPQADSLATLKKTRQGTNVPVTGVWRIWFEHLGREDQIQGDPVDVPTTSNPAHLFEIHPVTNFNNKEILESFKEIPGYTAYPAKTAFPFYEKVPATIEATDSSISITSGEGKYNYAEFVIELAGTVATTDDALFVLANVFDKDNEEEPLTSDARRMVFIKNTSAATQVANLSQGDRLHVLGVPRVNLAEVAAIASQSPIQTYLPYEMIIVAVLP